MAIVAASGDGSAPSTAANRKNNDGTIMGAGNIATTGPITSDIGINTLADNVGETEIGSKIVTQDGTTGDKAGVAEAASAGTLAFSPHPTGARSETFVIHGFTTKLSDVASTAIKGGTRIGDGVYDNIHGTIHDYKLGVYDINVLAVPDGNINPSRAITGSPGTINNFQNTTDTTIAVSGEIFPTRALPGELTYHFGGLGKPTTDEYKSKEDFETETGSSS